MLIGFLEGVADHKPLAGLHAIAEQNRDLPIGHPDLDEISGDCCGPLELVNCEYDAGVDILQPAAYRLCLAQVVRDRRFHHTIYRHAVRDGSSSRSMPTLCYLSDSTSPAIYAGPRVHGHSRARSTGRIPLPLKEAGRVGRARRPLRRRPLLAVAAAPSPTSAPAMLAGPSLARPAP